MEPPIAQLSVRLQPRASRNEPAGSRDGVLVARVTAPPLDGKADAALCKLIARAAGVAPSRWGEAGGSRAAGERDGVRQHVLLRTTSGVRASVLLVDANAKTPRGAATALPRRGPDLERVSVRG